MTVKMMPDRVPSTLAMTDHAVECLWADALTEPDVRRLAELHHRVWPKPGRTVEELMARVRALAEIRDGSEDQRPRLFVIRLSDRIIARATTLPRTIETSRGPLTVAGLAAVAAAPEHRGEGLGKRVVRAVFDLVDQGVFEWSLFQTSHAVKQFYEKLGARVIDNEIINSMAADYCESHPTHPMWDDVAMVYPGGRSGWPMGRIDLRGAAW